MSTYHHDFNTLRIRAYRTEMPIVREEIQHGRTMLILSGVAVVEGVMNYELVTSEELASTLMLWEDKPITITHPPGGATALEVTKVGRFYNVSLIDGTKLCGEFHLDVELIKQLEGGPALLERIHNGDVIEVSIGFYRNLVEQAGIWVDGSLYKVIVKDIFPDHVALLPEDIGACSITKGCGFPRAFQQSSFSIGESTMNLEETVNAIQTALAALSAVVTENKQAIAQMTASLEETKSEVAALAEKVNANEGDPSSDEEVLREVEQKLDAFSALIEDLPSLSQQVGELAARQAEWLAQMEASEKTKRNTLLELLSKNLNATEEELTPLPTSVLAKMAQSLPGEGNNYFGAAPSGMGLFHQANTSHHGGGNGGEVKPLEMPSLIKSIQKGGK